MTRDQPHELPDLDELATRSAWVGGRAGLAGELGGLQQHAAAVSGHIRAQAQALARPRWSPRTVAAVARTAARFLWLVWLGLLTRGAQVVRCRARRRGPRAGATDGGSAAVRRAQQLVHAGGPAYVKVGQSIATAQGLLPDEWVEAFAWCRDEVPPLPAGVAEQVVQDALGRPLTAVFSSFEPVPRAAASIAQVHDAVLLDGTEVVVKVQRPGLRQRFAEDLRVMAVLAAGAEKVSARARMGNARTILPLAAELILAELDFRLEARNMIHIAVAGEDAGTGFLRVPRPIPGLIREQVLVMERLDGVPYTVARERFGSAIDGPALLRMAATGVLEHALIYGVFHGDLHSGNVLVTETGAISLVDYGLCGRIDARERALLLRLLVASVQMDSRAQILAAAQMGALPPDADLEVAIAELERYQPVVAEFTDASFDALDLRLITGQMRSLIASLMKIGFLVPTELVLFSRNLLYLNGLAQALAPQANMLAEFQALLAELTGKYPQELSGILLAAVVAPTTQP